MTAAEPGVAVLAIDGPSASGKGTVAERAAGALGFHYLDSGALYRLVALAAKRSRVPIEDEAGLCALGRGLVVEFSNGRVLFHGEDVTAKLREEEIGVAASRVAASPPVREALLGRQRAFRRAPGLVAEGRDMGSVVFPEARLKVFLTADRAIRAQRRHKQLMEKGMYAKMADVVEELRLRDQRDESRPVSPLKHYPDAVFLDTTALTADEAVEAILREWRNRTEK